MLVLAEQESLKSHEGALDQQGNLAVAVGPWRLAAAALAGRKADDHHHTEATQCAT